MTDFTTATGDLSLQEMLADPIVQAMMSSDGVTKRDVESLIEKLRVRKVRRRIAEHKTGHLESSPTASEG